MGVGILSGRVVSKSTETAFLGRGGRTGDCLGSLMGTELL